MQNYKRLVRGATTIEELRTLQADYQEELADDKDTLARLNTQIRARQTQKVVLGNQLKAMRDAGIEDLFLMRAGTLCMAEEE